MAPKLKAAPPFSVTPEAQNNYSYLQQLKSQ